MWISFSLWAGGFFRNLSVVAPRWKRWAAIDASIEFRMTAFHCLLKDFYAPFLSLEETPERREREKKKLSIDKRRPTFIFNDDAIHLAIVFRAHFQFKSAQRCAAVIAQRALAVSHCHYFLFAIQIQWRGPINAMRRPGTADSK